MSPNLFVLHGTEGLDPAHPDASGGRVMALFGPERLAPASGASLPGRRPGRDGSEPRAASWYWSSRASPARTCATSLRWPQDIAQVRPRWTGGKGGMMRPTTPGAAACAAAPDGEQNCRHHDMRRECRTIDNHNFLHTLAERTSCFEHVTRCDHGF